MLDTDRLLAAYKAMRDAADNYTDGKTPDGRDDESDWSAVEWADHLRSAIVDYTDQLVSKTVTYDEMGRIRRVAC